MALDYGRVRTGVAVCDPTGTIVRPLSDVGEAATPEGLQQIAAIVAHEEIASVVVGMPVSLSGKYGQQAEETVRFINGLKQILKVPVQAWDERFTSKIAKRKAKDSAASQHSLAACCLLEDYLESEAYRRGSVES